MIALALDRMRVPQERHRPVAALRRDTVAAMEAARCRDIAARDAIAIAADQIAAPASFTLRLVIHALGAPVAPRTATIKTLGSALGIKSATLVTRAQRAGVSLTDLFDRIRLARAACVLHDPAISLRIAAPVVGFSAPQHICRVVQRLRGVPVSEWRATQPYALELHALLRALAACAAAGVRCG